jgi:predicted metal-dependent peptidase
MDDPAELKLSAARTRLILDKPFLGALVLRLPLVAADPAWCKSVATDARSLYYNREYVEGMPLEHLQFVLAHEAMHCALSHFARRQHRIRQRWDLACDFAVNPLLVDEGLRPPPEALVLDEYRGMTAEEIYPCIDERDDETLDQHVYDNHDSDASRSNDPNGDGGSGHGGGRGDNEGDEGGGAGETPQNQKAGGLASQPQPLTSNEREQLSLQWQQRLAGAAQQAQQAGKLGASMARLVDHLLQPQLPWRMLLARYLTTVARDDYSWQRPSRREGAAILPSLRSTQISITISIDTSGSLSEAEIAEFIAEVNAIKGQLNARVVLLPCDSELATGAPWVFESWDEMKMPDIQGGGGTSFLPPFAWAQRQDAAPDVMLYFTDALGEFPASEPPFPVIWLVKGKGQVPWGQRIQLN